MANRTNRSADIYYRAPEPLTFRGTREGRKNPRQHATYKQKPNDNSASTNKYYASQEEQVLAPQAGKQKPKVVELQAKSGLLPEIVAAFSNGATQINVTGTVRDLRPVRATVDMAVGRNTLTRLQADAMRLIAKTEETPVLTSAATPTENVVETAKNDSETVETPVENAGETVETPGGAPEILTTEPEQDPYAPVTTEEAATEEAATEEATTEEAPAEETAKSTTTRTKKSRSRKKKTSTRSTRKSTTNQEDITEADVAQAFGAIDEEGDD